MTHRVVDCCFLRSAYWFCVGVWPRVLLWCVSRYACKTLHQLNRLGMLCTLLFTRGRELNREERAHCTEPALLRFLRANEWDITEAHSSLDAELRWRFYEARPMDLLAFDMQLFRPCVCFGHCSARGCVGVVAWRGVVWCGCAWLSKPV